MNSNGKIFRFAVGAETRRSGLVRDGALRGLIGEHEPKGRVIVVGIGGRALTLAQDIEDAIFVERKTQRRPDGRAHAGGHVIGVKTAAPSGHDWL